MSSTVARDRLLHCSLPVLLDSDVGVHEERVTAGVAYLGLNLLAFFAENVGDGDPGALAGEQSGLLGTHAACRAGDYGYLAL